MAIVSVSVPEDLLGRMDEHIQEREGKGRSELVRVALSNYLADTKGEKEGHVHGSLTVVYPHAIDTHMSLIRHSHHHVVRSMMHGHCDAETCIDVMVVGGDAKAVYALRDELRRMKGVQFATLVLA